LVSNSEPHWQEQLELSMYLNVGLLAKAEYLAFFRTPFSLRRWAYVVFFTFLYSLMWLVVAFGRMLDHVFFRGYLRQPVRQPVFIVAPPRSGTTLTQKLLSLDSERFVHNKLYETIFPAVSYQKFFRGMVWLDQNTGRLVARLIAWAEKKWFGGWDDMHKMRFDEPEEDDGFFVYTFVTEAIFLLFLNVKELWEAGFQDALPPEKRHKVMAYYRSCLQRQLFLNGPEKTMLSKATQSSGAVESLLEEFPDARFITIIRHPYRSVASHVSVFYPVWHAHSPKLPKDSQVSKDYALLAVRWFQHLFEFRQKVKPEQYYCIDFRELTRDPMGALTKMYEHFGWKMSDACRERLTAATQREREFKSKHEYTLEEFGLSNEWIQQELGPVLDHYGLAR
jgi:omega-hydroxy-beta-dihydromenaquinone-9 sulfotransferase